MTDTGTRILAGVLVSALCGLPLGLTPASASASTDAPAALLVYPLIQVDSDNGIETEVVISNDSRRPVHVRCFYEGSSDEEAPLRVVEFEFRLTPEQPISWRANDGMAQFPLAEQAGPGGQMNRFSMVPVVPSDPFVGYLRCFAIGGEGFDRRNALNGNVTIERTTESRVDLVNLPAFGFAVAIASRTTPARLVLGGAEGEYTACPQTTTLAFIGDGAVEPITQSTIHTQLALVPCSRDYTTPAAPELEIGYEVVNEFGQRLATIQQHTGAGLHSLSRIDADEPERSIFHVASLGTFAAQLTIRSLGASGVLVAAIESHTPPGSAVEARRLAASGHPGRARSQPDVVVLSDAPVPTPRALHRVHGCVPSATSACGAAFGTVVLEPGGRRASVADGSFELSGIESGTYELRYLPACDASGCRPPIQVEVTDRDRRADFALAWCAGDCQPDGVTDVTELVRCVDAALGTEASPCAGCDVNEDGSVTVDEILRATTSALAGCFAEPSAP